MLGTRGPPTRTTSTGGPECGSRSWTQTNPSPSAPPSGLAFIAAVFIGLPVADRRRAVVAVETTVTTAFVLLAAVAVAGSPWLLVAGFVGRRRGWSARWLSLLWDWCR